MSPFRIKYPVEMEVRYDTMWSTIFIIFTAFLCTYWMVTKQVENGTKSRIVLEQILSNSEVQNLTARELAQKLTALEQKQSDVSAQTKDNADQIRDLVKSTKAKLNKDKEKRE